MLKVYPVREAPALTESALVSYPDSLLAIVDDIYSCRYPDLTATSTTPGARYFGRASEIIQEPEPGCAKNIVTRHQLIGTFGSQQFLELRVYIEESHDSFDSGRCYKELETEEARFQEIIASAFYEYSSRMKEYNQWLDGVRARFDFKPNDGSLFFIFYEWRRKNEHSGPCRKTGSD